jgi:4-amino-4-deoxy-L-arabinose transferase-like glycosyltransferase
MVVGLIFVAGLLCRLIILAIPHREGDEVIFASLVQELLAGRGYTLRGHPLLVGGWISAGNYDHALFFHPPGGIVLFLLLYSLFGTVGFALAQLLSYAIFFWSMMVLGRALFQPMTRLQLVVLATLAAFTPIMTHVVSRYWLDGPMLAFATAAAAVFILGLRKDRVSLVWGAGVLLGWASLIKATAFLIVPGVAFTALAVAPRGSRHRATKYLILFLALGAVIHLPWVLWHWSAVGTPLPTWAGKPSAELLQSNAYLRYVTLWLTPWTYFRQLPEILWTLVPSLVVLACCARTGRSGRLTLALVGWVASVVGVHVVLGFLGYSKVLRYLILVTPASLLLFTLAVRELGARLSAERLSPAPARTRRAFTGLLAALAAAGVLLEVLQGIKTPLFDRADLIIPLLGPP